MFKYLLLLIGWGCLLSASSDMVATYEDVKDVPNHPDIYLIDVRTRPEIAETGLIPSSIVVPLDELEDALKGSDEEFAKQYGRSKPSTNAVIIFTCRSGRRAAKATALAKELGYVNSKTYAGSWLEWAEKEGL